MKKRNVISVLFIAVTMGCSEEPNDRTWYDDASDRSDDRNKYIEAQKSAGYSDADATRMYDLNEQILRTKGKKPEWEYRAEE